jgi:hypothetical protein
MKASEVFALIVRVVGLLCLIYLVRNLANYWIYEGPLREAPYYITRVVYLAIGIYLIRGAPQLARFAFPDEAKSTGDKKGQ